MDLETLVTSPEGFDIATASPCQRAACRILDGLPLGELADDPQVSTFLGGPEALQALEGIGQPTEVVFLASIRSLKTIMACAAAISMSQRVDVSGLGPGEVPRVSIVSLKLDVSAVAFRILVETIKASRLLKRLLVDEPTADSLMLRHPSGRPVEITCVAGAKAGAGLVARWSAGVIFDEAPRMTGREDGVVNLDDARSAVLGRLLPGAQALYIGSPWAPHGPVYALVNEHWGKPTGHLVVLRGTGPMLNPKWWTAERCEALRERNPVAYQTDVLGEFADPESGLLNPIAVKRNTRETPLELSPTKGATYAAAVDPSEGGAGGNAWTLVIVECQVEDIEDAEEEQTRGYYRVALAREWRGLRPEHCWREIANECRRYGLTTARSDQYAAAANADLAKRYGLTLHIERTTAATKLEDFENLRTLIHTDSIELPPDRQFRSDLLSVKKRTTQTGQTIVLPKTGDGRHCDFAPALAAAVKAGGEELGGDGVAVIFGPGGVFITGEHAPRSRFFTDDQGRRMYRLSDD